MNLTRTSKTALVLREDASLKPKLIAYWVATAAFALAMLVAAMGELFPDDTVEIRVQEG